MKYASLVYSLVGHSPFGRFVLHSLVRSGGGSSGDGRGGDGHGDGGGGRQRVQRSQHRQVGIGTVLDFRSDSTVEKHDDDIEVVHTSRVTISSS